MYTASMTHLFYCVEHIWYNSVTLDKMYILSPAQTAFIIVTNFVKHLPCYFEGLYVQFWLIYMEMGQSDNV